jgi:hypothetical protein
MKGHSKIEAADERSTANECPFSLGKEHSYRTQFRVISMGEVTLRKKLVNTINNLHEQTLQTARQAERHSKWFVFRIY